MIKYAKIIDPNKGTVEVGIGDINSIYQIINTPDEGEKILYVSDFYKSLGMEEMDVSMDHNGVWYLTDKLPKIPIELIIKKYENAVQDHLDATAQSKGYDNTYTCLSYLSSTDEVWNRESHIFNEWRDSVWRKCHELLNQYKEGIITELTVDELIELLPKIKWNYDDMIDPENSTNNENNIY